MKIKSKPLVTIVVPVYNAEKYLEKCLLSLYNQTYKNIEVIIVNDGCTDRSDKIIDKFYIKNKKKTLVLKNKKPSGFGEKASNCAIKLAQGEYIAIMDSDDISLPDRIEKEVDFLEKHKDYFLVSTVAEVIDEKGNSLESLGKGMGYEQILKNIYLSNPIVNSSVMFRKSEINGDFYKIKYLFCNDYYSWFYYLSCGKKIKVLSEKLVKYRIHPNNSTVKNLKRNFNLSFIVKKEFLNNKIFVISFKDKTIIFIQELILNLLPARLINFLSWLNTKRRKIRYL